MAMKEIRGILFFFLIVLSGCSTEPVVNRQSPKNRNNVSACIGRRISLLNAASQRAATIRLVLQGFPFEEFGPYGALIEKMNCISPEDSAEGNDTHGVLISTHEGLHLAGNVSQSTEDQGAFFILEEAKVLKSGSYKKLVPRIRRSLADFSDLASLAHYKTYIEDAGDNNTVFSLMDEWNAYSEEALLAIKLNQRLPCQLGPKSNFRSSPIEMKILVSRALSRLKKRSPRVFRLIQKDHTINKLMELLFERTEEVKASISSKSCLADPIYDGIASKFESEANSFLKMALGIGH